MRMTNKIMQNNSLYNINQNKLLQDKLSTQMSTQKKLTRPSDDPVVAIRALRLRSSVSELTQYDGKNAPDADSWLKVTSDGLGTVSEILTDMSKNANKAANKDLTPDDLDIIVTQLKSLSAEFYATGNLDYAGRYVFTGYRTNTPMSFTQSDISDLVNPIPSYNITEQNKITDFDSINYTVQGNIQGANKNNYKDGNHDGVETEVVNGDIHRLRLAYENTVGTNPTTSTDDPPVTTYSTDDVKIEFMNTDGKTVKATITPQTMPLTGAEDPYEYVMNNKDAIVYIPDTGEILFGDNAYTSQVEANLDNTDTEIRVTYDKSEWATGDLRPEHYFACTSTDTSKTPTETIKYNQNYLDNVHDKRVRQTIEYDVGYNQTIQINTTADEVFTHNLNRDVADIEHALNELKGIYATKLDLEDIHKSMDPADPGYANLTLQVNAANKAYDYIRENIHGIMEKMITKTQNYLDATNVAITDNGTRSSRLDLITKRLTEQKTTFRTLQSENEDVDIAAVAIELSSAELTYSSSLMGTGKIMQTTLMNYI